MTLEHTSWQYIEENYPVFACNFAQEYRRCNGFIPYEPGFVYVIHAVGSNYYKIGKSINPDRRLLQIAPQMPFRTRFIKVWRTYFMSMAETLLHKDWETHRANGEWFELNADDLSVFFSCLSHWYVRYIYAGHIRELLNRDYREMRKSIGECPGIFAPNVNGAYAMYQVETMFRLHSESLDPGLPEDVAAIVGSDSEPPKTEYWTGWNFQEDKS